MVSASPTRSHPAVLFLLPASLATPQLALAGVPGCCLLPAGHAAASERRFLKLIGSGTEGGEQKVGADANGRGFMRAAISSLSVFGMLDIIRIVSHQLWHSMLDMLTNYTLFG